ncbi:MAG TPA: Ig-like domain-containing protein [Gemmatimonadaceae bacterium]|nr:Ig-like domain-containing protein [Gemmatimonadaceae bacterium]
MTMRSAILWSMGTALAVIGCRGSTNPQNSPARLTITPEATSACVGDSVALSASLSGVPVAPSLIRWNSLNPSVATVKASGVLLALQEGRARISATTDEAPEAADSMVLNVVSVPAVTVSISEVNVSGTTLAEQLDSLNGVVDVYVRVPSLSGCLNRQFSQAQLMLGPQGTLSAAEPVAQTPPGILAPDSTVRLTFNTNATVGGGAAHPNGQYAMFVRFKHAGSYGNDVQSSTANVTINNRP